MSVSTERISLGTTHDIAARLDDKARSARNWGTLYMGGSVFLGISIIIYFYVTSDFEKYMRSAGEQTSGVGNIINDSIGSGILRVGMVVVAIFIIQILVGFARYYFRLSEHISFSSEIIRLSEGQSDLIPELSSALLQVLISGKYPHLLYRRSSNLQWIRSKN